MAVLVGLAMLITVGQSSEGVIDDSIVQVVQTANEAGVAVDKLLGAMNTTGLGAREYLIGVGELDAPVVVAPSPPPAPPPTPPIPGVWARLAQCESGGNWRTNTGNGYYGGLQEDLAFWRNYGGSAYAARPDLASSDAQIAVAIRGQAAQGWGAWPVCSRVVGLRR